MTTELENWRELAETTKLGWPEWDEGHLRLRLRFGGITCLIQLRMAQEWIHSHTITDHEAMCLWRDHAWRWLETLDRPLPRIRPGDDSAEALQAAVRAADGEGKESKDD